ncbi:hypothetical protein [Gordonia sp. NB41Y]|uniref:hypothetical protein n=1 Tax=Gordonia sp. NB41Y TaxID=875808 RepID=UPI0006B1AC96|nr:hypothetical protein [Gordonia sp. NB41Y]KOY49519.1 hypothetical protein ISGA_09725 [Gordonia sp. NB41Y]WLP92544.1 hypothetical protein Q9K23_10100 [Gordonia sp. NB41Y]
MIGSPATATLWTAVELCTAGGRRRVSTSRYSTSTPSESSAGPAFADKDFADERHLATTRGEDS